MKTILFVCTGNIFRSMSAELLLKKYISEKKIKDLNIISAGITAHKQEIKEIVKKKLNEFNIDYSLHSQKKLTKEMIDSADLIITFTEKQKEYLEQEYNCYVSLFNKICFSENTSLLDDCDVFIDTPSKEAFEEFHIFTLNKINKGVQKLLEKIVNNDFKDL